MANYKPGGSKTNLWLWIVTICFAVIGIVIIIVVNFTNIVKWLQVFGITLLVICFPIIVWLSYQTIKRKINRM